MEAGILDSAEELASFIAQRELVPLVSLCSTCQREKV
jgi:hypothetical protein